MGQRRYEFAILWVLRQCPYMYALDIARITGIWYINICAYLDWMHQKGLVARRREVSAPRHYVYWIPDKAVTRCGQ